MKQAVENKNKKKSRNATLETQKADTSAPILSADENEAGPSCLKEPSRKKPRRDALPSSTDSEIDFNVCCMCFGTYSEDVANGDGRDWIECACGRWLHEDCAEDCLLNKDGKEMFCHSCIMMCSLFFCSSVCSWTFVHLCCVIVHITWGCFLLF